MEEPNSLIRWVIFFFPGGDAGRLALIMIGAVTILFQSPHRKPRLRPMVVGLILFVGLVFVLCSPLPLPAWFVVLTAVWLAAVIGQLCTQKGAAVPSTESDQVSPERTSIQKILLIGSVIWLSMAIGIEFPYLSFRGPSQAITEVLVIGDSVTAGLNDGEDTWPQKLARETSVTVFDTSQPGATLKSARMQNKVLADHKGLVLLEIGGNDMLEGLPVRIFEEQLNQLLTEVTQAGRSVVMFELPLPPFSRGYGLAQRRQAGRHGVSLIPKRQFASILTTKGATVDGIHLSDNGQTLMAELVRSLFRKQFGPGSGNYERLE